MTDTNLRGLFLCLSGDWDLLLSLWRYRSLGTNTQLRSNPPSPHADLIQDAASAHLLRSLLLCRGGVRPLSYSDR